MLDNFDPQEKKVILIFIALLLLGLVYVGTHDMQFGSATTALQYSAIPDERSIFTPVDSFDNFCTKYNPEKQLLNFDSMDFFILPEINVQLLDFPTTHSRFQPVPSYRKPVHSQYHRIQDLSWHFVPP